MPFPLMNQTTTHFISCQKFPAVYGNRRFSSGLKMRKRCYYLFWRGVLKILNRWFSRKLKRIFREFGTKRARIKIRTHGVWLELL